MSLTSDRDENTKVLVPRIAVRLQMLLNYLVRTWYVPGMISSSHRTAVRALIFRTENTTLVCYS